VNAVTMLCLQAIARCCRPRQNCCKTEGVPYPWTGVGWWIRGNVILLLLFLWVWLHVLATFSFTLHWMLYYF